MQKFISLALVIGAMIWASCSQDDAPCYSCDDEVNEMVKTNLEEIHSMTRSQWKDLDTNVSLAVYRAFTPEQKIQFCKEKFAEVKSLGWNEEELAHIEKAEAFVNSHPELFVEDINL